MNIFRSLFQCASHTPTNDNNANVSTEARVPQNNQGHSSSSRNLHTDMQITNSNSKRLRNNSKNKRLEKAKLHIYTINFKIRVLYRLYKHLKIISNSTTQGTCEFRYFII
jgi:hypothetical protein